MMLKRLIIIGLASFTLLASATANAERIKITFWHAMSGTLGQAVNHLVRQFNASQDQYELVASYKGTYSQTLTSTVAAFRAHQQPDIVQVFEVGTATMLNPKGIIVPVYQLMKNANIPFQQKDLLPAIRFYYGDKTGNLLAMPFNSSSAVMFYNKNAFEKAGLNPNVPPKTWPELKITAEKLIKAGYPCGFTTAWPSWIQIESFSAWQNLPFATEDNGFNGLNVKLLYNNQTVVDHIAQLARWQKSGIFRYGGLEDAASNLFTSQQCPIIFESSGMLSSFLAVGAFHLGVAMLPYEPNVKGAPQNTIIGGGALWALSGHSFAVEAGVAAFFKFLSEPNIQAEWAKSTGYLPVTYSAYHLMQQQGYYKKYPGALIAMQELLNKPPTQYSRGYRLGNYMRIRDINNQELQATWSGIATPQAALNDAVQQGDALLQQFRKNVTVN